MTATKLACPTCGEERKPRKNGSWYGSEWDCQECKRTRDAEQKARRDAEPHAEPAPAPERGGARGHRFNAQLLCDRCARSFREHLIDPRECPKGA